MDPNNPPASVVTDPATVHRFITTHTNVNIGPPGMFKPSDVRLADITQGLALTCRYNGQINRFYSVAEHSLLVAKMAELAGADELTIRCALFHDAHEAYIGDIASPHKDMIGPGWRAFEAAMEAVVREALGLPGAEDPVWKQVRVWDIQILHRELAAFKSTLPDWFDPKVERNVPSSILPVGLEWYEVIDIFRRKMYDLRIGLGGNA